MVNHWNNNTSDWWFGTWLLFSISYMGCHPSHWRTPSFFKMVIAPATSEIACLKHSILSTNIATLIFQGSISRQSANTYAFFRWKPSRLPVDSNTPGRLSFSGRVHDFLCQDIVQYPWIEHIVSTYIIISGWWFGKNIFPYIGNVIIPTVTHSIIFQRGWLKPPTR